MPARRAVSAARSRSRCDRTAVGRVVAAGAGDRADAQRKIGREVVGSAAEDVTLVDRALPRTQASVDRSTAIMRARRGWTGRPSICAPEGCDRPVVIECTEVGEQRSAPDASAAVGGWSMKRRSLTAAPRREFQREPGQVGLEDLRRSVARAACRARSCSTGGRPRLARCGRPGRRAVRPTPRLVATVVSRVMPVRGSKRGSRARPASTTTRTPSTVSEVSAMSVESTTRRRPGGDGASARSCSAKDNAPASGWTSTSALDPVDEQCLGPADLADARQEHQDVARLFAQRPDNGRSHVGSIRSRPATATRSPLVARLVGDHRDRPSAGPDGLLGNQCTSTSNMRPSLTMTGASSRRVSPSTSGVADIAISRRSGRIVDATSSASARPRSVVRLRSWTSSKITSPTPGSSGSFWRRRVRTPSVTTSMRVLAPMCRSSRVW